MKMSLTGRTNLSVVALLVAASLVTAACARRQPA